MGRKEATRTCAFAAEEVEEGCNPDRERAKDRLGRETGGCAIHRDFAQKGVYSSYTRKKRYYFEGLKARATGYVRLGASSSHSNSARSRDLEDYSSSRKVTMTQQGPSVTAGDRNWNDPNAKRSELESKGAVYVLLSPTVERVTSAAPPWSNY